MVFLRIFTLKEAKTVFVMKLTLSWLGPVVRFESGKSEFTPQE